MGFISGSLDKSLFNKESLYSAIGTKEKNGYAVIKITPQERIDSQTGLNIPIKGVYTGDGLEISINADWEDMGNVAGSLLGGVNRFMEEISNVANIGGIASLGASWKSKLIYKQSSRLELTVPMIVVDWEGNNQPVKTAILLSYYCLPSNGVNLVKEITAAAERFKTYNSITSAAFNTAEEGAQNIKQTIEAVSDSLESNMAGRALKTAMTNVFKDTDDLYTLRASPSPVTLEIGQFFKHDDMVIKSVRFNFSKEMTRLGPLFVKIDISLSSRKILTSIDSIGFNYATEMKNRSFLIGREFQAY